MVPGQVADTLDALAHKYGADKRSGLHGYTRFYERHLRGRKVSKLLEIGIFKGASLNMWGEFLPECQLYGIDTDPNCIHTGRVADRVHRDLVDQSDRAALEQYATRCGPWDVVVDDGSHMTSHQITSFEVLWPHVKAGGFYAIEDTFCSFQAQWADEKFTLFQYFDLICAEEFRGKWYSDDSRTEIDSIEFSTGLIVVCKAA